MMNVLNFVSCIILIAFSASTYSSELGDRLRALPASVKLPVDYSSSTRDPKRVKVLVDIKDGTSIYCTVRADPLVLQTQSVEALACVMRDLTLYPDGKPQELGKNALRSSFRISLSAQIGMIPSKEILRKQIVPQFCALQRLIWGKIQGTVLDRLEARLKEKFNDEPNGADKVGDMLRRLKEYVAVFDGHNLDILHRELDHLFGDDMLKGIMNAENTMDDD
jgi:hypothetical protein